MWFVYVLKSMRKKRFYIGVTQNINQRLVDHNRGGTKSTKPYTPWTLIYQEEYTDKKAAYKREYHLKHPVGYSEKLAILNKHGGVA